MMKYSALLVAIAALGPTPARAAYTINASEVGGNVIFTGSGSINLSALTPNGIVAPNPSIVAPTLPIVIIGLPQATDQYNGISGPSSFGTGPFVFAIPTAASGPQVGLNGPSIRVPLGYVSGSSLALSTSTYESSTFSSLGLATGTYVWNWGVGSTADTITLRIGNVAGPIPEPGTWALMLLGMGAIGAGMRVRRRQNVSVHYA